MHTCFYLLQAVLALHRQSKHLTLSGTAFTPRREVSCASPIPFHQSYSSLFIKESVLLKLASTAMSLSSTIQLWAVIWTGLVTQECFFPSPQFILYFKKHHRRDCHHLQEETSEKWQKDSPSRVTWPKYSPRFSHTISVKNLCSHPCEIKATWENFGLCPAPMIEPCEGKRLLTPFTSLHINPLNLLPTPPCTGVRPLWSYL